MQLTTDWTQIEVVQLLNDGSGLGFGIIGSKSTGVVVKTILPGGPADRVCAHTHTHTQTFFYSLSHTCLMQCCLD